jgi:chromosome segregation protein
VHFTKLRLTGFKSFVEATELWIEPGMTGIVGPNGCGKSNLVEALRWVMGETSAKQMRGGAMEDMIFGGTESRPARNIAEVSLHIDNFGRDAPPQYNDSETIDIVRRIQRGNGSNYRVNGAETRARDVQTLFADAASGARSTALVSQGRIGALIAAKPTDRRHLLEEAAGITGLHSRRHEAELRLRAAETNLERLDDVLGAFEEQLKALKRQARQATRYRNLSDHIRRAEAISFHHQWRDAEQQLATLAKQRDAMELAVTELTQGVAKATTVEAAAAEAVPGLREAEARDAAALHRLTVARDGLDKEEQRIEAERRDIESRTTQIEADRTRETEQKVDAEQTLARLDQEVEELTASQDSEAEDIDAANERLSAAVAEVTRLEQTLTEITEAIAADEAKQNSFKRQIADAQHRRARISQRLEENTRDRAKAEQTLAEETITDDIIREVADARARLDETREAADRCEEARNTALPREATTRNELQEADTRRTRLQAEVNALEALMTVGNPELWPPMVDAVSVEPGYEMAVAAAFGDDLDAPSDEASPVFWRTLPVYSSPAPLPTGAVALFTKVSAPDALARRLSQVGVVEDDDEGNRLSRDLKQGQRLVTREGALWRWDGFTMNGDAGDKAAMRLTQRNRLKDLKGELESADARFSGVRERFEKIKAEAESASEAEREARAAARAADIEFQKARDREASLTRKTAEARSRITALDEAAESMRADQTELGSLLTQVEEELADLPDITTRRDEAGRIRAMLSEARTVAGDRRSAHDRLIREAGSRRQRLTDIVDEIASWRGRVDNAVNQIQALLERQEATVETLEKLKARPAEIAEQRTKLFARISAAEQSRNAAADALAAAETKLNQAGRTRREIEAELAKAREERVRCAGLVEQIEQLMTQITERAQEHISCAPGDALEAVGVADDEKLPDREAADIRLERLKRERDNMGPVNLRAEVEAEELDERIKTMLSERDDLISAIARLRQGIASLNREGRTRLLAAFKEVDTHFQNLFTRLFGGGRAHLALTEADDPLDAGLEVMASPPGKKLQNLNLLSGGEQALTALALLFAVFLTNPAPICVLDEVDAPLDDANVDRFCSLIDEIAAQTGTRFLIVTHHRLTMARMDRLFGVTMAERGVSQLVSVDLQAAEALHDTG